MSPNMCKSRSRGNSEPHQAHESGSARTLVASLQWCIIVTCEPPSRATKIPLADPCSTRVLLVTHVHWATLHPRASSCADQCALHGRQRGISRSTPKKSIRVTLAVEFSCPGLRSSCKRSHQYMSDHADGEHGPCKVVLCRV
jgi:hypothetical protein